MELQGPFPADNLDAVISHYSAVEERLCSPERVSLCREAAEMASRLREDHGACRASDLAAAVGIRITEERWELAGGRILAIAECSARPPEIRLNRLGIELLARQLACWRQSRIGHWLSEESLIEMAVAHELYHLASGRFSGTHAETAAHAFVRALTGLPFSPKLCEALVRLTPTAEVAS